MMYNVTIGLEVHCEVKTNSKNFSSARNTYSEYPNENVDTIDIGLPGILPVANKEAFRKSLMMALALNCKTPDIVMFDRKNYYYPDLPKGYQITQMEKPVGVDGYVMINVNGEDKKIGIHDIHLEEDTASMEHFSDYSLIDYNRAGVPLLETVTTPSIHSADEAIAFLETLKGIFLYTGVSEARTDRGQMRVDVNISLSKDDTLGTRTEMKNINSFNNVRLAIETEIKRQTEVLENGGIILQETRRFDEEKMETFPMRSKVDAVDYKYYIEPNIPPIKIDDSWIEEIKKEIPMLQFDRVEKYMNEYNLSRYDSEIIVKDKSVSDYFEETIELGCNPKSSANWITSVILGYLNKNDLKINDIYLTPKMLVELINMVDSGKISSKQSKQVFTKCLEENKAPSKVVKELGMTQITDDKTIRDIVVKVLDEHPDLIEDHRKGKNTFDFFVGQVMKATRGQANPGITASIIREEIEKR
ncbi:MAG: Asp-tRNA(Asn)/Glu-tRNA(Gln) amidotransferase subunit GatB [Firmicutes bacterium]|nr:Asp-tRNA(Asn)/Glu-tRNA(Gln) amidotransferase subunit GatB [Bacillota bacterium]